MDDANVRLERRVESFLKTYTEIVKDDVKVRVSLRVTVSDSNTKFMCTVGRDDLKKFWSKVKIIHPDKVIKLKCFLPSH